MSEKIKPCPFCGCKDKADVVLVYDTPVVRCACCDGEGPFRSGISIDGAIREWNNRPIESKIRGLLSELLAVAELEIRDGVGEEMLTRIMREL